MFKAFFIDEAWVFLKNPSIQRYVVEALKTWRKHNAAMVLSTQSLDELRRSDILDVIIESCATKIFLANPDMDRDLYRRQFHLNENEVELIANLVPKQQFLIKTPELGKVANLNVDPKATGSTPTTPTTTRNGKRRLRPTALRRASKYSRESAPDCGVSVAESVRIRGAQGRTVVPPVVSSGSSVSGCLPLCGSVDSSIFRRPNFRFPEGRNVFQRSETMKPINSSWSRLFS